MGQREMGEAGFTSLRQFSGEWLTFHSAGPPVVLVGEHSLCKNLWRGNLNFFLLPNPADVLWCQTKLRGEMLLLNGLLDAMLQNRRACSQSLFLTNTGTGLCRIHRTNHPTLQQLLPVTFCPPQIITCTWHVGEDVLQSSLCWLANTVTLVCVAKCLKLQCYIQIGTNFPCRRKSTFHSSLWPKAWILSTHSYVVSEPRPYFFLFYF